MDDPQTPLEASPGLIEKLTTILEQARRGEITSFAAVTFMDSGAVNQWSFLTRKEDRERIGDALDRLKALHEDEAEAAQETTHD